MNTSKTLIKHAVLFSLALLLSACATTQSNISNGASFASAGITYVDAIPAVLEESFMLTVAADSHQLILSRGDLTEEERSDELSKTDELLEQRLELLRDLNTHALLLRSYFLSLKALTATENATGIDTAAQDVVARMAILRPTIADMSIGGAKISSLVSPIVNMAVGAYQNAALNSELKAHGEAIERELDLQKAAVSMLVDQMKDDALIIIQIEKQNPVFMEYVYESKVSDTWSDKRIAAFKQTVELQSLDDISKAASNLHSTWIAFVEKRVVAGTLGLLIKDIEQMLAIARQFKTND